MDNYHNDVLESLFKRRAVKGATIQYSGGGLEFLCEKIILRTFSLNNCLAEADFPCLTMIKITNKILPAENA